MATHGRGPVKVKKGGHTAAQTNKGLAAATSSAAAVAASAGQTAAAAASSSAASAPSSSSSSDAGYSRHEVALLVSHYLKTEFPGVLKLFEHEAKELLKDSVAVSREAEERRRKEREGEARMANSLIECEVLCLGCASVRSFPLSSFPARSPSFAALAAAGVCRAEGAAAAADGHTRLPAHRRAARQNRASAGGDGENCGRL